MSVAEHTESARPPQPRSVGLDEARADHAPVRIVLGGLRAEVHRLGVVHRVGRVAGQAAVAERLRGRVVDVAVAVVVERVAVDLDRARVDALGVRAALGGRVAAVPVAVGEAVAVLVGRVVRGAVLRKVAAHEQHVKALEPLGIAERVGECAARRLNRGALPAFDGVAQERGAVLAVRLQDQDTRRRFVGGRFHSLGTVPKPRLIRGDRFHSPLRGACSTPRRGKRAVGRDHPS